MLSTSLLLADPALRLNKRLFTGHVTLSLTLYPVVIFHFGVEPFVQHQRSFRILVRRPTARLAKVSQKVIGRDLIGVWHGLRCERLANFLFDRVHRRYVLLAGTAAEYLVGETDRVLMS